MAQTRHSCVSSRNCRNKGRPITGYFKTQGPVNVLHRFSISLHLTEGLLFSFCTGVSIWANTAKATAHWTCQAEQPKHTERNFICTYVVLRNEVTCLVLRAASVFFTSMQVCLLEATAHPIFLYSSSRLNFPRTTPMDPVRVSASAMTLFAAIDK